MPTSATPRESSPQDASSIFEGAFACLHHLLLGHARLCDVFSRGGHTGMIGLAHHAAWVAPAHPENARDREAAALMDDLGQPHRP